MNVFNFLCIFVLSHVRTSTEGIILIIKIYKFATNRCNIYYYVATVHLQLLL